MDAPWAAQAEAASNYIPPQCISTESLAALIWQVVGVSWRVAVGELNLPPQIHIASIGMLAVDLPAV